MTFTTSCRLLARREFPRRGFLPARGVFHARLQKPEQYLAGRGEDDLYSLLIRGGPMPLFHRAEAINSYAEKPLLLLGEKCCSAWAVFCVRVPP